MINYIQHLNLKNSCRSSSSIDLSWIPAYTVLRRFVLNFPSSTSMYFSKHPAEKCVRYALFYVTGCIVIQ